MKTKTKLMNIKITFEYDLCSNSCQFKAIDDIAFCHLYNKNIEEELVRESSLGPCCKFVFHRAEECIKTFGFKKDKECKE